MHVAFSQLDAMLMQQKLNRVAATEIALLNAVKFLKAQLQKMIHLGCHFQDQNVFSALMSSRVVFQAWLKRAEDQRSAVLHNTKDSQKAQDKLIIHQVRNWTIP